MGRGGLLSPAAGLLQKLSRRSSEFWECGLGPFRESGRDLGAAERRTSPSGNMTWSSAQGQEGTVPSVREWPPLMDGDSDTCPQCPGLPHARNQPRWRRDTHTNSTVCHCCWVPLPLAMSLSHCGPCPLSVNYLLAVPSPLAALTPRG